MVLLSAVCYVANLSVFAADTDENILKPAPVGQLFASPDDAVKALKQAVATSDRSAMLALFGPEFKTLQTGDAVQDAANAKRFASALAEGCEVVKDGEDKITIEVGTNNWPMPIPLVKADGQWYFDTASGKEEIINRHIGKDELCTIGVCRAYVTAQQQFASTAGGTYALKYRSSPGKKDGLYWEAGPNDPPSPFGPLVAAAHAEGYVKHVGAGTSPFHGYYYRILTRQGKDAPGGKMNYMSGGLLKGGFALVAYPEHWGQSGIMTFIVNQDGNVYQQDFGEKTRRIAGAIREYNPGEGWELVKDAGIVEAVSEK